MWEVLLIPRKYFQTKEKLWHDFLRFNTSLTRDLLHIRGLAQELEKKVDFATSAILESSNIQNPKSTYDLFEVKIFFHVKIFLTLSLLNQYMIIGLQECERYVEENQTDVCELIARSFKICDEARGSGFDFEHLRFEYFYHTYVHWHW